MRHGFYIIRIKHGHLSILKFVCKKPVCLILTNQDSNVLSAQKDLKLAPYDLSYQNVTFHCVCYPNDIESMCQRQRVVSPFIYPVITKHSFLIPIGQEHFQICANLLEAFINIPQSVLELIIYSLMANFLLAFLLCELVFCWYRHY